MIDLKVKQLFFDRSKVMRAVGRATAKNMNKAGARIRTVAKRSMRYRRAASAPGQPPSAHKPRALLRQLIFYRYDPRTKSVVIGPVKVGRTDAPERLEYGGRLKMVNPRRRTRRLGGSGEIRRIGGGARDVKGRFVKTGVVYGKLRTKAQVRRAEKIQEELYGPKRIRTRVKPRPFMGPAFEQVEPQLPAIWADSVRAG